MMRIETGAVFALALAASVAAHAEDAPLSSPPTDPQDISGIWYGTGFYTPSELKDNSAPPFSPAGQVTYQRRADGDKTGHPLHPIGTECAPFGFIADQGGAPFQIIQTPGQITFITEVNHMIGIVHMNGKHPKNLQPTYLGHSIGHWEGDTLVIDTVGFRPDRWLDFKGTPTGSQLHVTERVRKIKLGKVVLETLITIDDPENYTKPWTLRRISLWRPMELVHEEVCEGDLDQNRPDYVFDEAVKARLKK
jgi:hypothetical protein